MTLFRRHFDEKTVEKKIKKQLSTFFINQIINQYIYANVFNLIPLQKGIKIACSLLLRLTASIPGRLL